MLVNSAVVSLCLTLDTVITVDFDETIAFRSLQIFIHSVVSHRGVLIIYEARRQGGFGIKPPKSFAQTYRVLYLCSRRPRALECLICCSECAKTHLYVYICIFKKFSRALTPDPKTGGGDPSRIPPLCLRPREGSSAPPAPRSQTSRT